MVEGVGGAMTARQPQVLRAIAAPDRGRLELQVLVLQSTIAGFFVFGALSGMFGQGGAATVAAVGWVAGYHAWHAWYVLRRGSPGSQRALVEALTPLLDVSCITGGVDRPGQRSVAVWAVYRMRW